MGCGPYIGSGPYIDSGRPNQAIEDGRTTEDIMVSMIQQDLGVTISAQAWRMFIRHRFDRLSTLAHRIHEGKR